MYDAKYVTITDKSGNAKRWHVKGLVRSGSRGKEYQLGEEGSGLIHRLCFAPDDEIKKVRTDGAIHEYTY